MSIQLPLQGVRIVEFEGIGPGPLAGRMLADMGAEVTVVAPPRQGSLVSGGLAATGEPAAPRQDAIVPLDLKQPEDNAQAMALVEAADVH